MCRALPPFTREQDVGLLKDCLAYLANHSAERVWSPISCARLILSGLPLSTSLALCRQIGAESGDSPGAVSIVELLLCRHKAYLILKFLLDIGFYWPKDKQYTLLGLAVLHGNPDAVDMLLAHGEDPGLSGSKGYTPMTMLCSGVSGDGNFLRLFKTLLAHDEMLVVKDKGGRSPRQLAANIPQLIPYIVEIEARELGLEAPVNHQVPASPRRL